MQVLLTGRILINVYFEEHVQPYATEKEKRRNGSVIFFFVAWGKGLAVIRHFKRYSSMESAKTIKQER